MEEGFDILGIDVSHPVSMLAYEMHRCVFDPNSLVLVALGDTNDQVVLLHVSPDLASNFPPLLPACATYDEGADGAESSDALAGTVVKLDLDEVLLGLWPC